MKSEIPIEEIQQRRLMVCTPMYGGQCYGSYAMSLVNLAIMCTKMNIHMEVYTMFNESLIPRARSYAATHFLRSTCTHMLFIDADITFSPQSVIDLLIFMDEDNDVDVMCCPYPKKNISWEKVLKAANAGAGDKNPELLADYIGDYVFNLPPGVTSVDLSKPFEVMEAGTGFMMIKRATLEKYIEEYPELRYKPDHIRNEGFDGTEELTMFFDTVIDPVSKRYLSEDYMFCQYVRKMGGKVYMFAGLPLQHTGTFVFGGHLQALASVGATATADREELKKSKKQ